MKGLRYYGEFLSVKGRVIRAEIWKEGYSGNAEEVRFPADDPLVIEWTDADKLEPVLSSSATLKMESETDRQFLDELYTIQAGSVELRVKRDGALYWSGTLDTELYEEPYSSLKGYDVTVTFQDFGILERLKYDRTDTCNIKTLVDYCIGKAGITHGGITWKTSTTGKSGNVIDFTEPYVSSANWYDEEGEAMTVRDVLENVLKVFSLRLKQKAGQLYIYDMHTVYGETPEMVVWDGADSYLGTDKVYNDIEVTWSPYAPESIVAGNVGYRGTGQPDEVTVQVPMNDEIDGNVCESYLKDHNDTTASLPASWPVSGIGTGYLLKNREGFRISFSGSGTGLQAGEAGRYFRISPMYSGQEMDGIAVVMARHDLISVYHGFALTRHWHSANLEVDTSRPRIGALAGSHASAKVAAMTSRFYIPKLSGGGKHYIRLKVEAVIDGRLNPFESAERNFTQNFDKCDHIYVPFNFSIEGDDGVTYVWNNVQDLEMTQVVKGKDNWTGTGSAASYKGGQFYGLLHYCSNMAAPKDSDSHIGVTVNKPFEGYKVKETPDALVKVGDGDFLAMPEVGGWATVSISDDITSFSCEPYEFGGNAISYYEDAVRAQTAWFLIKSISVEIVDEYGNKVETSDYVTKATLNRAAREKLSIDTLLDTSSTVLTNANGLILDSKGNPFTGFCRNNVGGSLSELMCNTVYSQYAKRNLTLSGTVEILDEARILNDRATAGKFILLAESQRLRDDESRIVMAQFGPDDYCPSETVIDD